MPRLRFILRPELLLLAVVGWFAAAVAVDEPASGELPAVAGLPPRAELPDPFTMLDGTRVRTKEDWHEKRRPELKRLFQHYVYGYLPPPPKIEARVTQEAAGLLDGKAALREVEIRFPDLETRSQGKPVPRIRLALFLPAARKGPVPVFLALNRCGNEQVVADERVAAAADAFRAEGCAPEGGRIARGREADYWCLPQIIDRGYAFATFHVSDIDPDKDDFTDGIHPHYPNPPGPQDSRWGTISAWAWGAHRCVDHLVTERDIDSGKIAVIGHSRRGKTALWAAAMDERIALVVPHQSGTGGMALSRNNDQETVARINRSFPHWFNDTFPRFGNEEAKLPVDQHLLVALVAPRPLLDTGGLKDTWANYDSALRNLKAADAAYQFLGAPGLVGEGVISDEGEISARTCGNLLQYRRDERHTLNCDYWRAILDFADRHFGAGED
ncbi:MAG: acetylxylan esterase [Planctomycetales bacterium]